MNEEKEPIEGIIPPLKLLRGMNECVDVIIESKAPWWKKLIGYIFLMTPWIILIQILSWLSKYLEVVV